MAEKGLHQTAGVLESTVTFILVSSVLGNTTLHQCQIHCSFVLNILRAEQQTKDTAAVHNI